MKIRNILWKAAVVLMVLPCCTACNDDENTTIGAKYYIGTEVDPSDSYTIEVAVNKTDNVVTANMQQKYSFVIRTTAKASKDVQVSVETDEAMVATYNEAHGTTYGLLSENNYDLAQKVTIKSGNYSSTDSISIALKNIETLLSDDGFILPLRISSIEGNNGSISTNRSTVYVKVNVTISYPGNLELKSEPLNASIINRNKWNIECATPAYDNTYSIKYLIDGVYSSCYFCSVGSASAIQIDMQSEHNLKGLSIAAGYGRYGYNSYALQRFRLSLSIDGKKWTSHGNVTLEKPKTSTVENPFIQYIGLKMSFPARYVRIIPEAAYGSYVNFSEVNIYE